MLPCFDREVNRRPGAERLSEGLQRHLRDFAGIRGCHCSLEVPRAFAETDRKNRHQAESCAGTPNSPYSPRREEGKVEHSKRSTYRRNLHATQRLEVPRASYEESRTMTTPSLAHTPSTTRHVMSELYPGSLNIPSGTQHPNSPDLHSNYEYEDQWANIRHSQLIPENTTQEGLHEDPIRHNESLRRRFSTTRPGTEPPRFSLPCRSQSSEPVSGASIPNRWRTQDEKLQRTKTVYAFRPQATRSRTSYSTIHREHLVSPRRPQTITILPG